MKAIFKPLYLFIAASLLVALLLLYFLFGGGGSKPAGSGLVKIARDPTWSPLELADKMQQFAAFTDEILSKFAEDAQIHLQVLEDSPAGLYPTLWRRGFNAIISAAAPPPSLPSQQFLYSDNYYDFGTVLVVRANSKVTDLQGLKGKVIGVVRRALLPTGLGVDPAVLVVTYDSALTAFDRLINRTVDGVLIPFMRAYELSQGLYNGQVRIATTPLISLGVRMVVVRSPAGQALIDAFNKSLAEMHQNGSYDAFLKHWDLPDSQKVAAPSGQTLNGVIN